MHHPPLRLLIFDFDGVIAESIAMKAEAFRKTFSFVPEHQDEIVTYHLDNGGMSRYVKFRNIYRDILHEELTKEQELGLAHCYEGLVRERMFEIPLVFGAEAILQQYAGCLPLYVVSATPQEEMEEIVSRRGLSKYFNRVYGSPRSKADCIREILGDTGVMPGETLFIGDAPQDWQAAIETGVRFIGRVAPGDENRFAGRPGVEVIVSDLSELGEYLAEHHF
jgi:phosphoglycolate phosphatase-like HAD superfamily hydrolase